MNDAPDLPEAIAALPAGWRCAAVARFMKAAQEAATAGRPRAGDFWCALACALDDARRHEDAVLSALGDVEEGALASEADNLDGWELT